jgi:glycosyltransferase involved in cell wall biosynthesis
LKLLSENHRIFFIGFVKDKEELEFKKDFKKLCESFDVFFIQEDDFSFRFWLKVIRNLLSPYPYIKHKYYNKNASRRIREILSEGQIDLVHLDMLPMSTYYSDLNSTPTILTNHNVESVRLHRWIQVEKNIFIKSFLAYQYIKLRSYEKKMCPKFDKCVTVSSEDEKVLKKLCKSDNFAVIPNGVDIEYFKPLEGPIVPNRLIWVGGMSGPYNSDAVDYFLDEILPLIRAKKPEVEVDFVGGYPTKKLKQQELKNSHIKLHGFVDDTRPLVQKAAVFIAPIRSGSGTKIKVLNAMSLAKPVVTTSVGAEGISVEADKNIIIADDPKVFAEKTIYLLNNQHIANEMGMAGRKIIEKYYDWNVIKENMEQLYNEVKLLRFQ